MLTISEITALKVCKNCTHVGTVGSGEWQKFKCFAEQNYAGINLVDGHKEYFIPFCVDQRADTAETTCGKEGRWFEAKSAEQEKPQVAYEHQAKKEIKRGVSAEDL